MVMLRASSSSSLGRSCQADKRSLQTGSCGRRHGLAAWASSECRRALQNGPLNNNKGVVHVTAGTFCLGACALCGGHPSLVG